ncbi:MAG: hypothetical protein H7Y42_06760 [Chitinophagaceae bacterium]|nr:hypothetical protein [Chitinophagaceae bacterium]
MYLLARFFDSTDIFYVPLCFIILFAVIRYKANRQKEKHVRRLYFQAFGFRIICVVIFTLITEYYFKGGDTGLYYQATMDLRAALKDNFDLLSDVITSLRLTSSNPLFPYFYYDNYADDLTYNYMSSPSNFFIPKLALLPAIAFNNSYVCINMLFSFFALGGAIRLFKFFYHYYPQYWREIAIATLFLPDVCYWCSGLLKDPVCFGAIGYILYGMLNIFVKKRKIFISLVWIFIASFLIFYIKVYILLVLALSILIWLFAEFNKLINDKTLRRVFAIMTFSLAVFLGYVMINYLTSQEAAQGYRLDKIMERSEDQRRNYAAITEERRGSHFEINTSNPVLLVLNGVSATFYRPFPWEIKSPIMLLSAAEALIFLYLTLYFVFKRGLGKFFGMPFTDPRIMMCFIFSFLFAIAVGSTTANFGALSRYKIPCMPFYFLMLMLLYKKANLPYPKWFNTLLIKITGKAPFKPKPLYPAKSPVPS